MWPKELPDGATHYRVIVESPGGHTTVVSGEWQEPNTLDDVRRNDITRLMLAGDVIVVAAQIEVQRNVPQTKRWWIWEGTVWNLQDWGLPQQS